MTSGKRSSLVALVIKATLAENTNRAAICMAILVSSFILIREPRERRRDRLRILSLRYIDVLVKSRKTLLHSWFDTCLRRGFDRQASP